MSQTRKQSNDSSKSSASTGKTNRRSVRGKKDVTNAFKDGFYWDKYLQQCGLSAAPAYCFKQTKSKEPLLNKFEIDDKIEAQDPRNPSSICLATVVSLQGPRILLRLDGSDACNDFWRLVDSGDIFELGTHEAKGKLLQPPLGFTRNVSTWPAFLQRNRNKGKCAAKECFVKEPTGPKENLFEIGMKMEAVDKKNPHLICPATVGEVKDEMIFICFDGWRGAMDYWCDFESRDLFPVHWCAKNDHPLQEPGNKGDNPLIIANLKIIAEESKRQTRSHATEANAEVKGTLRTSDSRPSTPKPRIRNIKNKQMTPAATSSAKKHIKEKREQEVPEKMTPTPPPGDTTQQMSDDSSNESAGSSASSSGEDSSSDDEKATTDPQIRHRSVQDLETMPKSVESNSQSKPGRKKKRRFRNTKDRENNSTATKSSLDADDNETKHKKLRKSFSNEKQQRPEFPAPGSPFCQKTSPSSFFGSNRDEIVRKASVGWPSQFMVSGPEKVVTSDNKLGKFGSSEKSDDAIPKDEDEKKEIKVEETSADETEQPEQRSVDPTTNMKQPFENRVELPPPRRRPRNPKKWNVYDVMYFIEEQDPILSSYAHLFVIHEIDGEALLLLTSVMAVKFMGLKLGPALKLSNIVDKLKQQYSSVPSDFYR